MGTGGAHEAGGTRVTATTAGTGGTSGSPGVVAAATIMCGSNTCNSRQLPVNYQVLSTAGARTVLACCTGDSGDRCGLVIGDACLELDSPGTRSTQCRGVQANPGPNEASFDGCCKPDGTCGYLDSTFVLGCFFTTKLSANDTPDWCDPDAGTPADARPAPDTGAPPNP